MRFQMAIIACFAFTFVMAIASVIFVPDTCSKVLMGIVLVSSGVQLYLDTRKYLNARKQT